MKKYFSIILLLLWQNLQGQGCSDAGFCSIQGLNGQSHLSQDSASNAKTTLSISANLGRTFPNIMLISPILEGSHQFHPSLQLSIRIVSALRWHQNLTIFGLADAFLSTTLKLHEQHRIILGGKIPFHRAQQAYQGLDLPMPFQSSLGTYDLIIGYAFHYQRLSFHLGLQAPFLQNRNTFNQDSVISRWGAEHFLAVYPSTYQFQRSSDLLVRVSYQATAREEAIWKFSYSLLSIYHLKNDTYGVDKKPIEGSQGLTLNLNASASYALSKKHNIEVLAGFPVVARKVRPEGLSTFTFQLSYKLAL